MRHDTERTVPLKVPPFCRPPADPCRTRSILHAQEADSLRFQTLLRGSALGEEGTKPPSTRSTRGTRRALRSNCLLTHQIVPTGELFPSIATREKGTIGTALHFGMTDSMASPTPVCGLSAGISRGNETRASDVPGAVQSITVLADILARGIPRSASLAIRGTGQDPCNFQHRQADQIDCRMDGLKLYLPTSGPLFIRNLVSLPVKTFRFGRRRKSRFQTGELDACVFPAFTG